MNQNIFLLNTCGFFFICFLFSVFILVFKMYLTWFKCKAMTTWGTKLICKGKCVAYMFKLLYVKKKHMNCNIICFVYKILSINSLNSINIYPKQLTNEDNVSNHIIKQKEQ